MLPGTLEPVDLDGAKQFFSSLPCGASMMLKAVAGGGGRGMRAVHAAEELEEAYARCTSEAVRLQLFCFVSRCAFAKQQRPNTPGWCVRGWASVCRAVDAGTPSY